MKKLFFIIFMISIYTAAAAPTPNYNSNNISEGDVATNASQRSCENNREFIFQEILKRYLSGDERVFEVGTGTADQTTFFCQNFPNVTWQTSDQDPYYFDIIRKKITDFRATTGIKDPVLFNVDKDEIPQSPYDVIYISNVIHCMPLESSEKLFAKAAIALKVNGLFIIYGPFKVDGQTLSTGNHNFDQRLLKQDKRLGLRYIYSEMNKIAESKDFILLGAYHHAKSNNWALVFQKI